MADRKEACALFLVTKDSGRRTKGVLDVPFRTLVFCLPRLSWGLP
jgi:hypothetical protein